MRVRTRVKVRVRVRVGLTVCRSETCTVGFGGSEASSASAW